MGLPARDRPLDEAAGRRQIHDVVLVELQSGRPSIGIRSTSGSAGVRISSIQVVGENTTFPGWTAMLSPKVKGGRVRLPGAARGVHQVVGRSCGPRR